MKAPKSDLPDRSLYRLLRFSDGLVVDPDVCPRNIAARSHWSADANGNAVCPCDAAEAAAESEQRAESIANARSSRRHGKSPRPTPSAQRKAAS